MLTYKKITLGLVFGLLCLLFFANGPKAEAALDPKFLGSCAQVVDKGSSSSFGASCRLGGNGVFPPYATVDKGPIVEATYQTAYNASPDKPAERITMLTPDLKPLIQDVGYTNWRYLLQGTSEKGTKYYVYVPLKIPTPPYYLVTSANNTTPRIYALVYDKVNPNPGPSNDYVYAWMIDKVSIASTLTGAPDPGSGTTDDNSCEGKNNTGLEWLLCGVIRSIDSLVTNMNEVIENQLDFEIDKNLNDNVKQAWTIFRNVATALLVIVMLVMVIAQAISAGPFDAYTVRKILPRLVAAVILMQISWYLFRWAIEISNNAGHGMADLMYAPFGGEEQLNLDKQLGRLGFGAPAATLLIGLTTGVLALVLNPFGVALLAFAVLTSIFIGLVVLLLRKLLIVLCMILVPLALVAWILPGTQRYWKLWYETFIKLLLMFPLIIALIATGRIFAWVAGTTDGSPGLLDLFVVLIGFFGVYWLLPKTFQWGGGIFGTITGAMNNATNKGVFDRGRNWLQGQKEARHEWKAYDATKRLATDDYRQRRIGIGRVGLNVPEFRSTRRAIDRYTTGTTPVTRANRQKYGRLVEQADKFRQEEIQRETVRLMEQELVKYPEKDHDDIREAIAVGKKVTLPSGAEFDGTLGIDQQTPRSESARRAALDRAVIHGQWGAVDQYYTEAMNSGVQARINEAQRFKNANAQVLGDKLTHVVKGYGVAVASNPEGLAKMTGHEIESLLAEFSSRVASGDTEAPAQLDNFLKNYAALMQDPIRAGQADQRGAKAVKAFITNNVDTINKINDNPSINNREESRRRYNLQTIKTDLGPTATDSSTRDVLINTISDTGTRNIGTTATTAPPTPPPPATGWSGAPPEYPPEPQQPPETPRGPNTPPAS